MYYCDKLYTAYIILYFLQMVQINGNLKVKLPPLKKTRVRVEAVEPAVMGFKPAVMGFVGECRVVLSATSVLELSLPCITFTSIYSLDFKAVFIESW